MFQYGWLTPEELWEWGLIDFRAGWYWYSVLSGDLNGPVASLDIARAKYEQYSVRLGE